MKKVTIMAAALVLLCGCSNKNEIPAMNAEIAASEKSCDRYCECISCLKNRYLYCTSLGFSNAFVTIEPDGNVYYDTASEDFVGDFYFCVHDKNGELVGETAPLISGSPAQRFALKADEISGMVNQYTVSGGTIAEFKMDGFSTFYRLSYDKGAEIFYTPDMAHFFCENDSFSVEESTEKAVVLVGENTRITFDIEKLTAQ